MIRRALGRLGWAIVVVWAVATIAFALNEIVPSDPARLIAGPQARPQEIARVREQLGLERPVAERYAIFVTRLVHFGPPSPSASDPEHGSCAAFGRLHFDLGRSYVWRRPVVAIIGERLPRSAALAGAAVIVQLLIGLSLGTFAAARRRTKWDAAAMIATLIGASIPTFLVGLALQYTFAQRRSLSVCRSRKACHAALPRWALRPSTKTRRPSTRLPVSRAPACTRLATQWIRPASSSFTAFTDLASTSHAWCASPARSPRAGYSCLRRR